MPDPLCTCGHAHDDHAGFAGVCLADSECPCDSYCPPGSLEDILGVWRDQGPFPLRNTADVALLVDEIVRLRSWIDRQQPRQSYEAVRCPMCGRATEYRYWQPVEAHEDGCPWRELERAP